MLKVILVLEVILVLAWVTVSLTLLAFGIRLYSKGKEEGIYFVAFGVGILFVTTVTLFI